MNDEPAGRGAALPGGAKGAPQRAFDGEIEIGVFHDDLRILAAELERNARQILTADRGDLTPDRGRAGKRNQLHVAMTHQRGAHFLAASMNQIDDPRRHAGLVEDLDESCRGMRRIFRRLEDHGVAADQRGKQLPGRDRQRKIPRRDQRAHADRRAHGHGELIGQFRRRGFTEQAPAFAGHIESAVDPFLHVAAGFFEHLAHFAGLDARELFFIFAQKLADTIEQFTTLWRRHQTPTGKGIFRGLDCSIHICRCRGGKQTDQIVPLRRIAVLKSPLRFRRQPLTIDKVLECVGHRRTPRTRASRLSFLGATFVSTF